MKIVKNIFHFSISIVFLLALSSGSCSPKDCTEADSNHNTLTVLFKQASNDSIIPNGYDSIFLKEQHSQVSYGLIFPQLRFPLDVQNEFNTYLFYKDGLFADSLKVTFNTRIYSQSDRCGFQIETNNFQFH